jgi:hypothetical protein
MASVTGSYCATLNNAMRLDNAKRFMIKDKYFGATSLYFVNSETKLKADG